MRVQMGVLLVLMSARLATAQSATTAPADVAKVRQAWISSGTEYRNTDSLAACRMADGRVRVFATSKAGHCIDSFDGETGRFVRRFGRQGPGPGEFLRPNGIVAVQMAGDRGEKVTVLAVIERDNARVQIIWPEDGKSAGVFGHERLKKPYGAAVSCRKDGVFLYVTDENVPPAERVKVFRLAREGDKIRGEFVRTIGDADGKGAVLLGESIAVDDDLDRLLICDEDAARLNVKIYTREGRFTGQTFGDGLVRGQPEGLVVYATAADAGFVLLTDQQPEISVWHVFDRRTARHLGAFTGKDFVANTDGISLYPAPFGRFRAGALFAVNNDNDVHAFSFADILEALRLPRR